MSLFACSCAETTPIELFNFTIKVTTTLETGRTFSLWPAMSPIPVGRWGCRVRGMIELYTCWQPVHRANRPSILALFPLATLRELPLENLPSTSVRKTKKQNYHWRKFTAAIEQGPQEVAEVIDEVTGFYLHQSGFREKMLDLERNR